MKTGANGWKIKRTEGPSWSSPVLLKGKNGKPDLVLMQSADRLTAIDPATGKTKWEWKTPVNIIPSVTPAEDSPWKRITIGLYELELPPLSFAGLRYVRRTPALAIPLAMMALVGTLGYNFQVILPLLARFSFDGGAAAYTTLAVAMAVGSVVGALAAGAHGRVGPGLLTGAALGFGAVALIAAAAPTLPLEAIALVPLGAASVTFAAGINSSLQLAADPAMRGRVMALYSMVFLGSTPIGGPIAGWLSEATSPRAPTTPWTARS